MNSFYRKLKQYQDSGVSLVQILMASSAIAGLAVVGLKMAEDQKRLVQETFNTYLIEYYLEEVSHILEDKESCSLTFQGLDPLSGSLSNLKKSTPKGILKLFGTNSSDSGKGSYFNGRIDILGYRLSSENEEVSKKKGITDFVITLALKNSGKKVQKTIPLNFKANPNGTINSCVRQMNAKTREVKGFWKKSGKGVFLDELALVVGAGEGRKTLFSLNGSLQLSRSGGALPCNQDLEGVLIFSYDYVLKYCQNGNWRITGEYPINWERSRSYNHSIASSGSLTKRTEEHRYCYLSSQSRKSLSDGCKLKRVSKDLRSTYEIQAYTNAPVTMNDCEVRCVD